MADIGSVTDGAELAPPQVERPNPQFIKEVVDSNWIIPAPDSDTTAFGGSPVHTTGRKDNPLTGSEARTVEEQVRNQYRQLFDWLHNREDGKIATWLNAPANATSIAQMDQDIAKLRAFAPNSTELALLLQIRALKGDQLSQQTSAA